MSAHPHTVFDLHKYFTIGDDCWLWHGTRKRDQRTGLLTYGRMYIANQNLSAHRLMYKYFYGIAPGKKEVCHSCDQPNCVRPSHLFLGTHRDNMGDMARKRRGTGLFSKEQILAIRADPRLHKEIAVEYGVTRPQITEIKLKRRYRWVA